MSDPLLFSWYGTTTDLFIKGSGVTMCHFFLVQHHIKQAPFVLSFLKSDFKKILWELHTMYFDHSQPNSSQVHSTSLTTPSAAPSPPICPMCIAHILVGTEPSIGGWPIYHGPRLKTEGNETTKPKPNNPLSLNHKPSAVKSSSARGGPLLVTVPHASKLTVSMLYGSWSCAAAMRSWMALLYLLDPG